MPGKLGGENAAYLTLRTIVASESVEVAHLGIPFDAGQQHRAFASGTARRIGIAVGNRFVCVHAPPCDCSRECPNE